MHQFLQHFVVQRVEDSDYDQERSDLVGRRSRLVSASSDCTPEQRSASKKLRNKSVCQMVKFTLESSFEQNWIFSFSYLCTWGFHMCTLTWECKCTLTYTYNCEGHIETDLLHSQQFDSVSKLYLSATPSLSIYPTGMLITVEFGLVYNQCSTIRFSMIAKRRERPL